MESRVKPDDRQSPILVRHGGSPHGLLVDPGKLPAGQEIQPFPVLLILGESHPRLSFATQRMVSISSRRPFLQVLAHAVQVGGQIHAGGEDALPFLAFRLAVKLFPPFPDVMQFRAEIGEHLDGLSLLVKEEPGGRVAGGGVFGHVRQLAILGAARAPLRSLGDIEPGDGDRQQPHGGQDRITAPHVVGNHEGRVAFLVGHALEGALGLVGDGHDAFAGFFGPYFFLDPGFQDAEGHGRLGGGARLGNDADARLLRA